MQTNSIGTAARNIYFVFGVLTCHMHDYHCCNDMNLIEQNLQCEDQ